MDAHAQPPLCILGRYHRQLDSTNPSHGFSVLPPPSVLALLPAFPSITRRPFTRFRCSIVIHHDSSPNHDQQTPTGIPTTPHSTERSEMTRTGESDRTRCQRCGQHCMDSGVRTKDIGSTFRSGLPRYLGPRSAIETVVNVSSTSCQDLYTRSYFVYRLLLLNIKLSPIPLF